MDMVSLSWHDIRYSQVANVPISGDIGQIAVI